MLTILLGLGAACFIISRFDAAIHPQLAALAEAKLRTQLVATVEQALEEIMAERSLATEDLLISLPREGQTGAVTLDVVRLNTLRSALVSEVARSVGKLDRHDLGIPLGALTGLDLLSAAGPHLPVRVISVASAKGEYCNEFLSAGINQTLYRVVLNVELTARLLLPGGMTETTVSTPVVIGETLIIGQVPQTYLHVNP